MNVSNRRFPVVSLLTVAALAALTSATVAVAADPAAGYIWNEMYPEKLQALRARGDVKRGAVAFEVCQGCHRAGALGRVDGSYPRLAGQHDTVLIKQLTDVRAGIRENPKMLPFADKDALKVQEIADIAAYLQSLPVPAEAGVGPGDKLERGAQLYARDCQSCHGARGEGDADRFFPRVSGQHFKYLFREAISIRDGGRRNADPRMLNAIRGYSNDDLSAVVDYMSRLRPASVAAAPAR